MTRATILVVDDEPNILSSVRRALELESFRTEVAGSGAIALEKLAANSVDLVLVDVMMPEMSGLEFVEIARERFPEVVVVMMSGNATVETAVQATKLGATDFIEKPLSTEKLLITVSNALALDKLRDQNAKLRAAEHPEVAFLGNSEAMAQVFTTIERAAPTKGRVLITGENGTGKELVAKAIHYGSKRADGPFVRVNCAAIPSELIESELFGHEKGAFTGAQTQKRGKFELANGGTLFLDEIGDMTLEAQAKVLRVLQENELERVGGSETIKVDARVIAATNKVLPDEISKGTFREDLYYRLNVVPIHLPPLRERKLDIKLLVSHFVTIACEENGLKLKVIDDSAIAALSGYSWPGNVRELKNVVERAVILTGGKQELSSSDLQSMLPGKHFSAEFVRNTPLKELVAAAERELVTAALLANDGHVSNTAKELGLERSHLYKKMKALGIRNE